MFLFLKLVSAHLIADYILQFEELYQLKVRGFLGQILHALIHGAVTAVLLLPYLNEPVIVIFIIALIAEHLLQDLLKYHFTKKIPAKAFIYYMTDQVFHILALAVIFLFPIANEVREFPAPEIVNTLYRNTTVTLFCIFFILLTFAANYTLNSFYRSYVKTARPLRWITSLEMSCALIERSVIAGAVIFLQPPLAVLLSLSIGLMRLPFEKLRNLNDFLISAGYTLILSYCFIHLL